MYKILKKIHNTGTNFYTSDRQVQEIPCVSTYSIKMIKKIEEGSCRDIAVNCSKVKWFSLAGKKCFLLKHILSAFVTIQSTYVPGQELSKAKKN